MGGTVMKGAAYALAKASAQSALAERVGRHAQAVIVNEQVGNPRSTEEMINVVIVEGDHLCGAGVVVSEPVELDTCPAVCRGDFVEWQPGPGGFGRVTRVASGDCGASDSL